MNIRPDNTPYNSKRKHKTQENGKRTVAYTSWKNMVSRCYNAALQARHPTYIGCTLSSEWLDFQNFADWFYSQKNNGVGYDLDKDILFAGNKVYSPDTCRLVPHEINCILSSNPTIRGDLPQGVNFNKKVGRYYAQIKMRGSNKTIGVFDCPYEAYEAYKIRKEGHVRQRALYYKNKMDNDIFDALMKWELT